MLRLRRLAGSPGSHHKRHRGFSSRGQPSITARVRLPPAAAVATLPSRWSPTKGCSSLRAPSRRRGGGDSCGSPGGPRRPRASPFANPTRSPAARAATKRRWRKRAAPRACCWSRSSRTGPGPGRASSSVDRRGACAGRGPPAAAPTGRSSGSGSSRHDLDLGDARHHRARNGRRPEARISTARSRHPPRSGRRCGGLPPGAERVQGSPAPDRPPSPDAHPGAVMAMLPEALAGFRCVASP